MQLHVARLCMDCDEVHDAQMCPVCGSETFAYISRWIPAPERRHRPRDPEPSPTVDTYRELLSPTPGSSGVGRWLRRGAVGLAAVTAVGWAWQRRSSGNADGGANDTGRSPGDAGGVDTRGSDAGRSNAGRDAAGGGTGAASDSGTNDRTNGATGARATSTR